MLKLKKEDYEKILDHCRKGLPNESCGLLGGTIEGDVKTSRPSEEDKRLAFDPNIEYLILSLMDAENPVLKAFGVDKEKNVTVHELQITE